MKDKNNIFHMDRGKKHLIKFNTFLCLKFFNELMYRKKLRYPDAETM